MKTDLKCEMLQYFHNNHLVCQINHSYITIKHKLYYWANCKNLSHDPRRTSQEGLTVKILNWMKRFSIFNRIFFLAWIINLKAKLCEMSDDAYTNHTHKLNTLKYLFIQPVPGKLCTISLFLAQLLRFSVCSYLGSHNHYILLIGHLLFMGLKISKQKNHLITKLLKIRTYLTKFFVP